MKNIFYFLCAAAALASCSSSYNIQGTSDVQNLDGHMLYIKALQGNDLKNIDSCDVVHGKFEFRGTIDTVKVGTLFINNEGVMPIGYLVLEVKMLNHIFLDVFHHLLLLPHFYLYQVLHDYSFYIYHEVPHHNLFVRM